MVRFPFPVTGSLWKQVGESVRGVVLVAPRVPGGVRRVAVVDDFGNTVAVSPDALRFSLAD